MQMLVAGIAAALCAGAIAISGASANASESGLEGRVTRGPSLPLCVHSRPCQVRVSATTLVFYRKASEVGRVRTSSTGAYRIALAPGLYSVRLALRPILWRVLPQTVRVLVGRYARVNFLIDTGIQ